MLAKAVLDLIHEFHLLDDVLELLDSPDPTDQTQKQQKQQLVNF